MALSRKATFVFERYRLNLNIYQYAKQSGIITVEVLNYKAAFRLYDLVHFILNYSLYLNTLKSACTILYNKC